MNLTRHQLAAVLLISLAITFLSGCASAPSVAPTLSDETIKAHRGDLNGLFDDWLAPNLRNGKINIDNLGTQKATESMISKDFERFCTGSGGKVDLQPHKFGFKNVCNDANGAYLGEIETTRYHGYLEVNMDSPKLREQRRQNEAEAEARRKKVEYLSLADENFPLPELSRLIQLYENNDPESLVPQAKTRRDQLQQKIREQYAENMRKQQAETEARLKALEKKQIGDHVCNIRSSTAEVPTGYAIMSRPQYRQVNGESRVSAYVEQVRGMRVQVRIASITFQVAGSPGQDMESFSHFDGDTIRPGSMIWSDIHIWKPCTEN